MNDHPCLTTKVAPIWAPNDRQAIATAIDIAFSLGRIFTQAIVTTKAATNSPVSTGFWTSNASISLQWPSLTVKKTLLMRVMIKMPTTIRLIPASPAKVR
jgi:hypothetical protein